VSVLHAYLVMIALHTLAACTLNVFRLMFAVAKFVSVAIAVCSTAMHCTDVLQNAKVLICADQYKLAYCSILLTFYMYRYEGLRTRDFLNVMRGLRDSMEDEHGPYNKRPSCKVGIMYGALCCSLKAVALEKAALYACRL
jgi:hypothetical protein